MIEKKTLLLLASTSALSLTLQGVAYSAPIMDQPALPPTQTAAPAPPAQEGSGSKPASPAQGSTSTDEPTTASPDVQAAEPVAPPVVAPALPSSPRDIAPAAPGEAPTESALGASGSPGVGSTDPGGTARRHAELIGERNRRYQEMRSRAAEHGLDFPAEPPWARAPMQPQGISSPPLPPEIAAPTSESAQSANARLEERRALREQRYQEMRERAMQHRQERQERLDTYRKILEAMTPEQQEAIEALYGPAKGHFPTPAMGPQMPSRMCMQPPMGCQHHSFPGYGFEPQGAEPRPFNWGPAPTWYGPYPMYPGSARPWSGGNPGTFQGPPPPGPDVSRP